VSVVVVVVVVCFPSVLVSFQATEAHTFLFLVLPASACASLFVADEPVAVVLQDAGGGEVCFTLGDLEGCNLSFEEFQKLSAADLAQQDYLRTEAECLGVLGDRMMMEAGRVNKAGEIYQEMFSLVTLNEQGKITMFEAFTDANAAGLLEAVAASK